MIDDCSGTSRNVLSGLPQGPQYRLVVEDLETAVTTTLLRSCTCLIHLAADSNSARSADATTRVAKNADLTRHCLAACDYSGTKFVFPSSSSLYAGRGVEVDESSPIDASTSPYAAVKLVEENLILSRSESNATILRFGSLFGVTPGMKFHTAVSRFCYQAVTTGVISVWRTALRQKRPYLAVEDAVAALEMAAMGQFAKDLVVNVATTTSTVETIIQEIRLQDVTVSVQLVDSQIMNEDSFEMRIGLAMEHGFRPRGSLRRGISSTIAQLRSF